MWTDPLGLVVRRKQKHTETLISDSPQIVVIESVRKRAPPRCIIVERRSFTALLIEKFENVSGHLRIHS